MQAEYKISLPAVESEQADPLVSNHFEMSEKRLGFVPNMYRVMANSPALLDTYINGYSRFRELSGFSPAEQEVIFLTISHSNGCAYCMAAHSFIADKMSGLPEQITDAIRDDNPIAEPQLAALHRFTRILVSKRGLPNQADVSDFLAAGYSEKHILEIILAIAVKTLSNYANHLFHTPVDAVFAQRAWVD